MPLLIDELVQLLSSPLPLPSLLSPSNTCVYVSLSPSNKTVPEGIVLVEFTVIWNVELVGEDKSSFPSSTFTLNVPLVADDPSCTNETCPDASCVPVNVFWLAPLTLIDPFVNDDAVNVTFEAVSVISESEKFKSVVVRTTDPPSLTVAPRSPDMVGAVLFTLAVVVAVSLLDDSVAVASI